MKNHVLKKLWAMIVGNADSGTDDDADDIKPVMMTHASAPKTFNPSCSYEVFARACEIADDMIETGKGFEDYPELERGDVKHYVKERLKERASDIVNEMIEKGRTLIDYPDMMRCNYLCQLGYEYLEWLETEEKRRKAAVLKQDKERQDKDKDKEKEQTETEISNVLRQDKEELELEFEMEL